MKNKKPFTQAVDKHEQLKFLDEALAVLHADWFFHPELAPRGWYKEGVEGFYTTSQAYELETGLPAKFRL